ncbi:high-potential iron-sulfur protein [Leptospira bouyouniensis]|uniref:High-potential iron-sulfur protein n=1 Tax=Leptospira bouyouniensis TaxID=2484911 RepID=A0A7I0HQX7_9LEPT|nr:high-potential iron-sulfur protein [Leptospira bouyouniensis]TGK52484.1 high-potential iron-sulfur protein [Leptospira bouyouniensis]TGL04718.1 high-potential iron-sulfur protein [Leptospira bouyouniensis]TGM74501.1 high-potential iron-sulfur protein [Leptospira bouyouniensis]
MNRFSRKQFLNQLIVLVSTLSLFGGESAISGKESKPVPKTIPIPEGETPVSENEPTAQALGFHQDAIKTDYNLYPDRKLPEAKNQFCATCSQFTKINEGWGKCNILSKGLVSNHGWCSAWSKRY